ncbi:RNA polymerase sigma factor SigX [Virgibacillus dakarensis]|nr:RNA polymerase sigma factor SigX [Virgibacillus dakarensis]
MKVVFDELYDRYHQDLYQFIFYMVKNKETAEDLIQEVYLKILKSLGTYNGDSSEKTWIFAIARHTTIDYFRSQKRKRNRISEFFDWYGQGHLLEDEEPLPDELVVLNDEMQAIYRCLDKCTIDQRSVLLLRYINQFSIQDTADILGFSISKVRTTQHRGLKVLRKYLTEDQKGGDAS